MLPLVPDHPAVQDAAAAFGGDGDDDVDGDDGGEYGDDHVVGDDGGDAGDDDVVGDDHDSLYNPQRHHADVVWGILEASHMHQIYTL